MSWHFYPKSKEAQWELRFEEKDLFQISLFGPLIPRSWRRPQVLNKHIDNKIISMPLGRRKEVWRQKAKYDDAVCCHWPPVLQLTLGNLLAPAGVVCQNKCGHQLAKLPLKAKLYDVLHCLKLNHDRLLFCLGKAYSMPDMAGTSDKGTKKLLILWIGGRRGRGPSSMPTDWQRRNESCKCGNGDMSHSMQGWSWPKMLSPGNVSSFLGKKKRGLESLLWDLESAMCFFVITRQSRKHFSLLGK